MRVKFRTVNDLNGPVVDITTLEQLVSEIKGKYRGWRGNPEDNAAAAVIYVDDSFEGNNSDITVMLYDDYME